MGRPVLAGQWQQDLGAVQGGLDAKVAFAPVDELRWDALSKFATGQVPAIGAAQLFELNAAVVALHAEQPEEYEVETTKVLVRRPGRLLMGLADDERLEDDAWHMADILGSVTGRRSLLRNRHNSIRLGTMLDHTQEGRGEVIHALSDNMLPTHVKLGRIAVGLKILRTGERLTIG
jgi:hypothetical protein